MWKKFNLINNTKNANENNGIAFSTILLIKNYNTKFGENLSLIRGSMQTLERKICLNIFRIPNLLRNSDLDIYFKKIISGILTDLCIRIFIIILLFIIAKVGSKLNI